MATEKESIMEMIKNLPDDISMEDIIEAIYVRKKIEKGLKDSEEGNLYTHEEAKELLKKWLQ
jgi:predicted transcriptional regulator